MRLTVDALTIAGGIQIAHSNAAQLEDDYALIQRIVDGGIFHVR